jgi:hypothetical protein
MEETKRTREGGIIQLLSVLNYPIVKEISLLQVYLPSALADGLQVVFPFWL